MTTNDAFVAWYRTRTSRHRFEALAGAFGRAGVTLVHPGLGTAVLLDVEGDQVRLPADRVAELVGFALGPLTVEWWFDADTNVICSFAHEPFGWEKQTYHLDGLTPQEARTVEEVLLGEVRDHPGETVALVVDRTGRTVEFDWDAVVRGDTAVLGAMPEALVLDPAAAGALHGLPSGAVRRELDPGLVLLTGPDRQPPEG
ncbi:hypothetical protein [Streptomyces sp. BE20]|uniref:hypothetical protein n=1 Tax=Streptomycetaceae TaxID=2062 RepID=UPI002E775E4A|nr:hypothetical protein [Streptomyces sp. BE20]MEE1827874.1 hypothetical protein [Streptomyces sp. BE20]